MLAERLFFNSPQFAKDRSPLALAASGPVMEFTSA
jgi:hypothetical protein